MVEEKEEKYLIFFSRSLDEKINPFTQSIKKILRNGFGFRYMCTVGLTYIEDKSLLTSISEQIKKSDVVICCFTKDIKTIDGRFISKPSVYMEYAIAKAFDKPIVSFVEKGVEINSMVNASTQYITVSKTEIIKIKTEIEKNKNNAAFIKSENHKTLLFKINSVLKSIKIDVFLDYYAKNINK